MSSFHYRGKFLQSDFKNEHFSHSREIFAIWRHKWKIFTIAGNFSHLTWKMSIFHYRGKWLPFNLKNEYFSLSRKIVATWRQKKKKFLQSREIFSIWLKKWAFFTFEENCCHMTSKMSNFHYQEIFLPFDLKNEHFSLSREMVAI